MCYLVPNRIVRNAAWLLDAYVHTFDAKWNKAGGEATSAACWWPATAGYLEPNSSITVQGTARH
jgi:hypothetical protein